MVAKIQVKVFWIMTPLPLPALTSRSISWHHTLHPEDRGSNVFWNDILLQHYMVSTWKTSTWGIL